MTTRESQEGPQMDDTSTAVELVPARDGTWGPAPVPPRNPVARAARAWLRECVNPTAPNSYLGPGELCLIRTHLHWLVPLRSIAQVLAATVSEDEGVVLTAAVRERRRPRPGVRGGALVVMLAV